MLGVALAPHFSFRGSTCPRQTLGAVQSHAMATCYPHCHASMEHLHKATTWPGWDCTCPRQTLGAVQSHAMATCYPRCHASMEHLHKATTWPGWGFTCPRQTFGAVQSHAMATCYPHCHASMEHLHKATTWPGWYCITADAIKSLHWGLNPGPSVHRTDTLPLSYRGCWAASAPKV